MSPHGKLSGLARFLYTQNPFYLISAGLIMYGIYVAFHSEQAAFEDPWLMVAALCGYAMLMAITAVLIIRLGKVWEDARSIVLIVLLQFVAISSSFDEIAATDAIHGCALLSFGFFFSAAVSELLLFGLGIRLRIGYRLPYYLLLGLFFFYPLWLSPDATGASGVAITWRMYLFPVSVGVLFLGLIPALHRGAAYVAKNGTPWPWPLFPWSAFAVLAVAGGIRAYAVSHSFNVLGLHCTFGTYFLVPMLLALLIVLAEMSRIEANRRLQWAIVLTAPLLLVLSIPMGDNFYFVYFLRIFQRTLGSPVWLTILALTGFYGYAWLRRLPLAESGWTAMLALFCLVDRQTIGLETLAQPHWWPLAIIGGFQLLRTLQTGSSLRCTLGWTSLVAAAWIAWHELPLLAVDWLVALHFWLAGALVIGILFNDGFAHMLRRIAAVSLLIAASWIVLHGASVPEWVRVSYLAGLTAVTWVYWWWLRERWWWFTGLTTAAGTATVGGWELYWLLDRRLGPEVLVPLSWGLACFAIGAAISAVKAGLYRHLRSRLLRLGVHSQSRTMGVEDW